MGVCWFSCHWGEVLVFNFDVLYNCVFWCMRLRDVGRGSGV